MEQTDNRYLAILDGGVWHIGYFKNRGDAEREAIKVFNVRHSKVGQMIVNEHTLEMISKDALHCLHGPD